MTKPKAKAPAKRQPKKNGRPTKRTPAVIARIVEGLSAGTPLTVLCQPDEMPATSTFYEWMEADAELSGAVARAREAGFDQIALDALGIQDAEPERFATEFGDRVDTGAVAHQKNRAELRLKLLKCWDPKRYGDMIKHAGADGGPMQVIVSNDDAQL